MLLPTFLVNIHVRGKQLLRTYCTEERMKKWAHKIEVMVDHLIPYALVILLVLIILEVFYYDVVEPYHLYIEIGDFTIIFIFIVDLGFKYVRAKSIPKFFRESWLDIIAVLPAFIMLRLLEVFATISRIEILTSTTHGALETGAKWTRVVQEVEEAGKASRFAVAERFLKTIARIPRFAKALVFFEKPTKSHHKKRRRRQ